MTCETANILLLFHRPGPHTDLSGEDTAELEAHLSTCPACASRSAVQSQTDAAIARAMQDVAIPRGLRQGLLQKASRDTARLAQRRWLTRSLAAGLLATVGLAGWGSYVAWNRPNFDSWVIAEATQFEIDQPERVLNDWLSAQGIPQELPEEFDPHLLTFCGWDELQGERVPMIEFRTQPGMGFARVYFLKAGQFSMKDATETQNSLVTVRLYRHKPTQGWSTVIVHTGNGLQPFLKPRLQPI